MKKLSVTTGCTCWSYTVDEKEFIDLSMSEKKDLVHSLIDKIDDSAILQSIFTDFMQSYGDYESDGEPCECCGDIIETWTYDLDEEGD